MKCIKIPGTKTKQRYLANYEAAKANAHKPEPLVLAYTMFGLS